MSEIVECGICGCKGNLECGMDKPLDLENCCTLDEVEVCPCCSIVLKTKIYMKLRKENEGLKGKAMKVGVDSYNDGIKAKDKALKIAEDALTNMCSDEEANNGCRNRCKDCCIHKAILAIRAVKGGE